MTQQQLAELLGVSMASIHRWERPTSQGPRGVVFHVLNELNAAAVRDSGYADRLAQWMEHGRDHAIARIFIEAANLPEV